MDYDPYMSLFSTVFQDFRLFSFSLRDNVSLGVPQDDARVEKALRGAALGKRLESLPNGIDTSVYKNFDEHGFEPSGGEAQKIALARAHFCDRIIVFENGRILEQGTQEELMKKRGRFYELFRMQAQYYMDQKE